MRLIPPNNIKVAGKEYEVDQPVYDAIDEYFEQIQMSCRRVRSGITPKVTALNDIEVLANRVLEET